ncbi:HipA domain-containing protein [Corynebacterium felinum]|uniref:Serine/threonine-protein kinase HipA n=1 Tax=Corynebacterium felinum TaxID=131318 RepID=A0ABU2B652_9CORY|nr:HipA domain-containing protein [Corynebacterium felinum]MDF5821653.1 HipA domain-containing protein [Corynebacterium felinum]MDR7353756.1 serine/threonine-protein kinase HipA [Corynebacterium felinum]WJY95935.1 hypothetical protein CFELI_11765 [Corynebacterium felinum]
MVAHTEINQAVVYVDEQPAALLSRHQHTISFDYLPQYQGPEIATTLPRDCGRIDTGSRRMPAFFSALLPEGHRRDQVQRQIKSAPEDELTLMVHLGAETVGNVRIFPAGGFPHPIKLPTMEQLDLAAYANYSVVGLSWAIPGVQPKEAVDVEGPAVVKVAGKGFSGLVSNEQVCLHRLRTSSWRHPVAKSSVTKDSEGVQALVVSRFDRVGDRRFRVEDATQVLGIYPEAKYSVSYEDIAFAFAKVCSDPVQALRSVAYQVAVAWLSGNGDLHAKNFSVIDRGVGFEPAPLYDVPSTAPYGDSTLALTVGGKNDGLSRKRFLAFCAEIGVDRPTAESIASAALGVTENLSRELDYTCDFHPRQRRDCHRILHAHRKHWE